MDFSTFKEQFKDGKLQITSGISYNMREQLEENVRLIHGKFKEDTFQDGTSKIFYNLVLAFSNMVYRNTDIDTKDINCRNTSGKFIQIVSIIKYALRHFLRVSGFNRKLNEFRLDLIREGHLLVKDVNGVVKPVNLLNVIIPPHVDSVQDSGLIEATYLTYDQMLEFKSDETKEEKEKWEKVEKVWEHMQKQGEVYFTVYEYWTIDEFEDEKGNKVIDKGCIKYLDTSVVQTELDKNQEDYIDDFELDRFISPKTIKIKGKAEQERLGKENLRVYPYKESRFVKVKGRYFGFGVAELISGLQEDYNEKMNLKRKFDRLQLRGILVHRKSDDVNKAKNLSQEFLNNIDTGMAISMENDESLDRLNLGSTTFDTVTMIDKLFELMRIIIGVNQQSTGEHSPSTVTATVGAINQQAAQTTYDVIVEEQAIFLTDLFQDFLLEDILNDLTKEDIVALSGDLRDLKELDRFLVTQQVYRDAHKEPIVPLPDEIKAEIDRKMQEQEEKGKERFMPIKKELIDLVRGGFVVEFYVSNEGFDKQTRIINIREMLRDPNYSGSRPALEAELRDLIGLDGAKYDKTADEIQAELDMAQAKAMAENPPEALPDTRVSPAQATGEGVSPKQPSRK